MHNENGVLCHTYYGKRLPDCDHSYMVKRQWYNGDFQSNVSENLLSLDNALLEYPAFGDGGITNPALEVLNADGTNFVDLKVVDYTIHNGKPEIKDLPAAYCEDGDKVESLEIKAVDSFSGVEVHLFYAVFFEQDYVLLAYYLTAYHNRYCGWTTDNAHRGHASDRITDINRFKRSECRFSYGNHLCFYYG